MDMETKKLSGLSDLTTDSNIVSGKKKIYKKFWIMERKRSRGYRRIIKVAFLLFLAPARLISQPCMAIINIYLTNITYQKLL